MNFNIFLSEEKLSSTNLTSIPHLKNLDSFDIERILKEHLVIVEKVDGIKFSIVKTKDGIIEYWSKKNKLDKAMRIIGKWDILIDRLEVLKEKTNNFSKLLNNSEISGEFFSSAKTNTIAYSKVPKGNFVVFYIKLNGKEFNSKEYPILWEWADYLESERQPVLFSGKLSDKQIYRLKELIKQEKGSSNFISELLNIINPQYTNKEIEGIIIYSGTNVVKIVHPSFYSINKERWEENKEQTNLIRKNLLNFVLSNLTVTFLKNITNTYSSDLKDLSDDDKYIFLINKIFLFLSKNLEIKELNDKFKTIEFESITFNEKYLSSKIRSQLNEGFIFKELYRLLLLIFRKEKLRKMDIFKDIDLNKFNELVKILKFT